MKSQPIVVGAGPMVRKGVLLPRRRGDGQPLQCRNRGKVFIRVGHINVPATGQSRSRRLRSLLTLAVSMAAVVVLTGSQQQHGSWFTARDGAGADAAMPVDDPVASTAAVTPAEDKRYRALSDFVARRYRVSQEVAYDLVHLAHITGRQLGVDPLLIIAVIAIESRFNPIAESIAGAKGLMQIIPKYHTEKFAEYGGERAVFDPVANIRVGAQILKDYIGLTGNLGIALQMYAGALADNEDQYTTKVMNEQQRLKQVLSASPAQPRPALTRTAATTPRVD